MSQGRKRAAAPKGKTRRAATSGKGSVDGKFSGADEVLRTSHAHRSQAHTSSRGRRRQAKRDAK